MLAGRLRSAGVDVVTTCEPGGTPLGRSLRAAFLETEETVSPHAELLLFAADRAQHVEFLIRPSIAANKVVISDRYADATTAYQGAGRGFDREYVEQVIAIATDGLKPDLTLFFDIPVERAIERMRSRRDATHNRMDAESWDFYDRVRSAYLEIAAAEPDRFRVVDGDRSIEEVQADAFALVDELLKQDV